MLSFVAAGVNVARELAAVAIAENGDIEQAERILRRAVNLFGEKDCAGAGAEKCAAACREFLQRVEKAFFFHHFQMRGAFSAGEDYAFDAGEIFGAADEGVLGVQAIEDFRVGVVIALDGEDSDFCVVVTHSCQAQPTADPRCARDDKVTRGNAKRQLNQSRPEMLSLSERSCGIGFTLTRAPQGRLCYRCSGRV